MDCVLWWLARCWRPLHRRCFCRRAGARIVRQASAVVRTSCEVEYSVVIPADVEIPFGALDTTLGHVYADVMKLEAGMGVYVAVTSRRITA